MVSNTNNSGVSPTELLLRQNGTCYLEIADADSTGVYRLYCTDGVDRARTDCLSNPTTECSVCFSKFILSLFLDKVSYE